MISDTYEYIYIHVCMYVCIYIIYIYSHLPHPSSGTIVSSKLRLTARKACTSAEERGVGAAIDAYHKRSAQIPWGWVDTKRVAWSKIMNGHSMTVSADN